MSRVHSTVRVASIPVCLLIGLFLFWMAALPGIAAGPPAGAERPLLGGIAAISTGYTHTCALTQGGGVKCWGSNDGGLGDGTYSGRPVPADVPSLTNGIQAVVASHRYTCALTTSGGVKCWGQNDYGQLGNGTTTGRSIPDDVAGLSSGVQAVAAGGEHACALTTTGGVKCWGRNEYGQLGDGTTTDRLKPVDVTGLTGGVQAIAAGYMHTCALTTGGGVYCWGYNATGQLGDGTTANRSKPVNVIGMANGIRSIGAGVQHTCALTDSGSVKCWGRNFYGALGDGTTTDRLTPVSVNGLQNSVRAISVGGFHTCALLPVGSPQCWGANWDGQIGDGTNTDRLLPASVSGLPDDIQDIQAGDYHTCALTAEGGVQCWGSNDYGQIGNGTSDLHRFVPAGVSGLGRSAQAVTAGDWHTCALAGEVHCWGLNNAGQLGDGTDTGGVPPVRVVGLPGSAQALAAGESHTCALTAQGSAHCWGWNLYGQLGNGTATNSLTPVDVSDLSSGGQAIAAGGYHTCALTAGGVKCWGYNELGQLGDGTKTNRLAPVDVKGLDGNVQTITLGGSHTCALSSGRAQCWGYNRFSQLGDGTTTDRTLPVSVIGLDGDVQGLAAGENHTCALLASGGVKCWGSNSTGQLGDGAYWDRSAPTDVSGLTTGVRTIVAGNRHTCALMQRGTIKCWGSDGSEEQADGLSPVHNTPVDVLGLASPVQAIAAGSDHTCVVTTEGAVLCWGDNSYGQLGIEPIWTPVDVIDLAPAGFLPSVSAAEED